jgi:hypothetical protein
MGGVKGDKIWMKKSDFLKEHKKLIALLEKYPKKDLQAQAAEQKAEVKELVGSAGLPDEKKFPDNYPEDVLEVLGAMSFGSGVALLGSSAIRSQQYAGDYDAYEMVEMDEGTDLLAAQKLRKQFQQIIRDLQKMKNVYIGDIKAGIIPEWRILPENARIQNGKVKNYNYENAVKKVEQLLENKIITPSEATEAKAMLHRRPTVAQFLQASDALKFHIVRWTPMEVKKNKKTLRDGSVYTLEEAFLSPTITKLDTIALVQNNRFTDFSIIYEFKNKGKTLNPSIEDIGESLQEDIDANKATGNYFKALKRMYALAKYKENSKELERLTDILNSDLGRLYHIVSDIRTLEEVVTDFDKAKLPTIKYEIDQFKSRLANVYSLPSYLSKESDVLAQIRRILKMPRNKMAAPLQALGDKLDAILQSEAKKLM